MAGRGGEDSGRSPATPYRAIGEKGARFLTDSFHVLMEGQLWYTGSAPSSHHLLKATWRHVRRRKRLQHGPAAAAARCPLLQLQQHREAPPSGGLGGRSPPEKFSGIAHGAFSIPPPFPPLSFLFFLSFFSLYLLKTSSFT